MKPVRAALLVLVLCASAAWGAAMPSSARNAVPSTVQQIISVDYRTLKNSETAMALKAQVLPPSLKEFEDQLKTIGINPDKDADQLTFASYRGPKGDIRVVGVAQGSFSSKVVLKKMRLNKIKALRYHDSDIYPMSNGMVMTFLDDNTLLFGDGAALKGALDTRDGYNPGLDSNSAVAEMIGPVESGTVWSVLDQQGTQNMLISALGDAGKLADFDMVKKRVQGSRYQMNFTNGVTFDLDVVTGDSVTAGTLSSLVKAGVIYRKMTASPIEKVALQNVVVNSDGSDLQMHFKADDKQFQSLLHSDLFAAVSK